MSSGGDREFWKEVALRQTKAEAEKDIGERAWNKMGLVRETCLGESFVESVGGERQREQRKKTLE